MLDEIRTRNGNLEIVCSRVENEKKKRIITLSLRRFTMKKNRD